MRKWFSLEEAEEAIRAKPSHIKMFENLKDRLAILLQEQKEAAERRKAMTPPEEESRTEAEDPYVLAQTNGIIDRSSIPMSGSHLAPPPLPTHSAHSLPHHSLPLGHHPHHPLPQHSPHPQLSPHQQHSPHSHHPPHSQHSMPPHQMSHGHHHLPPGVMSGHVGLTPEMGHVSSDGIESESHTGRPSHGAHSPQSLGSHQHSPHSAHGSYHLGMNAGNKRKIDDMNKEPLDGIPPPPPLSHTPTQQ